MLPAGQGGSSVTTIHVLTAIATAVVILAAQALMRHRSRQTFWITRVSDREFRISFEEPTEEQVAHVAHAVLRELGWADPPIESRSGPVAVPIDRDDAGQVHPLAGRVRRRSRRVS